MKLVFLGVFVLALALADRGLAAGSADDGEDGYSESIFYEGGPYIGCEGHLSCIIVAVPNLAIWTYRDGYPALERSVVRKARDFAFHNREFCEEHRRNDLCRLNRGLGRVGEDVAKETHRFVRQVGAEVERGAKKGEREVKRIGRQIDKALRDLF